MSFILNKIITSFLVCLSIGLASKWSYGQIPESLRAQLDTLEGPQRLEAWSDWMIQLKGWENPGSRIQAVPIILEEAAVWYPADSLTLWHFDLLYSLTYKINEVVYFKETTALLDDLKTVLEKLEAIGSDNFITSKIKWYRLYAKKLRRMDQINSALEYYQKTFLLAEEHQQYLMAHRAYVDYGDLIVAETDSTRYPEALQAYEKAEAHLYKVKKAKPLTMVNFIWGKALLLEDLGRYEEAKTTYESYIDSLSSIGERWGLQYKSDYADLLSKVGQIEKAMSIVKELKQKIPPGSDPYLRMYFLEEYTYVLASAGDIEQSIELHKEYKDLIRADNVGMGQEELLLWHTKYDRDTKQAELERLQLEAKLSETSFNSKVAVFGALFVLGIAALFFIVYKNKNKQKQLAIEVETAQAVTANRDRLFSSITHDIRTPLALMLAPLERAEGKTQNPKVIADLQLARKNGIRLMKLFTQILDWNKVEANALILHTQLGNLDVLFNNLTQDFEQEAIEKGVILKKDFQLSTAQYRLDFDQLEKILTYTFDHRLKHCHPGDELMIQAQIIGQQQLKLILTDNGTPPSQIKETALDEHFFKSDKRSSEKGLGLGLTIVRDLLRLMNGELKRYSANDQLNALEIIVPIEFVANAPAALENNFPSDRSELPSLLIVEDEPDLLRLLSSTLSSQFIVETANTSADGFLLSQKQIPDVIITDWNLPDHSGGWLIKKIKRSELLMHIPIIVLTANNNEENKREAFASGAITWMSKPFQIKNLERQLQSLLKQQKRARDYWKNAKISTTLFAAQAEETIDPLLKKVFENIQKNYQDEQFSVDQMAKELAINRVQLYRKTKKLIDKTPSDLIRDFRLEKAQQLLQSTEMTIAEVAYAIGFSNPNYFSTAYKKAFGLKPSKEVK